MTTETLHPRVAEIIRELDATQQEFMEFIDTIPDAERNAPANGRWSIGEHLEHLAVVEDGTGRLMSKLIKQIQGTGARETDDSPVLHSLDQFQIWKVNTRLEAPEIVRPKEGLTPSESIARQAASRSRVKDVLRAASGLALSTATAPHPYFGQFDVYQWGIMLAHHQRRHAECIRELLASEEPA
jgi:hypothetical protein